MCDRDAIGDDDDLDDDSIEVYVHGPSRLPCRFLRKQEKNVTIKNKGIQSLLRSPGVGV